MLPNDFKEFLRLLNERAVEYLLIGGYAVSYHGYPRATNDLDLWIAIHPDNAEQIILTLRDFGFDVPGLSAELFLKEDNIVRMGVPPMRIELLTTISGVDFRACYARRVVDELGGVQVDLIGLNDLLTNKKAAGRYKDLDDLEHLS